MTAETLYRHFLDSGLNKARLADLRDLFYADNHESWYMTDAELQALGVPRPGASSSEGGSDGEDGVDAASAEGAALYGEARWEELSNRMQMEMEAFAKQSRGIGPGT